MFKNYFKVAFRSLLRNRVSSAINIGGLAVGMTVALLIGFWLWDELSFNKSFAHYHRIAQVMQNQTFNGKVETWSAEARQLGPELRNSYGSNFKYVVRSNWMSDHLLTLGEKRITQQGIFMEAQAPEMFSLKMLKGSRNGLQEPNSILLAESAAKAIFNREEPVGKILQLDNKLTVKVTGVYQDLPYNSSFSSMNFMAPWDLLEKSEKFEEQHVGWGNSWFQVFVQLADHADMKTVSKKIMMAKANRVSDDEGKRFNARLFLHPMSDWWLYGNFENGFNAGGRIQYIWLFGLIGVFVLLLACINFMNLSTARSEKRAREVGIRKTVGSLRRQLVGQFFCESVLVASLAAILSLLLVIFILPSFNQVADKKISIPWTNPFFWLIGIGFALFTGIIAGSYPALYLSSFNPIKALKGVFKAGKGSVLPRRILVVVQFTVSVILIICTIVVFRQIQFAKNRPTGYSQHGLVSIPIRSEEINKHFDVIRNELLQTGMIDEVAASGNSVTQTWTTNSGYKWKGKDPNMQEEFVTVRVTHEFGKTIGWQIKEGRDFSREYKSDSSGFVINEAAVKYMGLKNPIGETMDWRGNGNYKIIGVVRDMLTRNPYEPVRAMIFFLDNSYIHILNVKINPRVAAGDALAKVETIYKKYDPVNPFTYQFAQEDYARKFNAEQQIGKLASFFASLAIFISCLGLFGMASFVAEQRTKEIGVRKVLGASVFNLWRLLSREFVLLVIISSIIASPIAYFFMQGWLRNYQYRTNIAWWIFGATALGALGITLLTVSYQAIKAALMNPVRSLKTE